MDELFSPERFIPARAGNTEVTVGAGFTCAVYPRSRGEHFARHVADDEKLGLSPLARGRRSALLHQRRRWRFIPARAGNTAAQITRARWRTVYPRSRGEHLAMLSFLVSLTGLSPLARGTPTAQSVSAVVSRFIPARAGNTIQSKPGGGSHAVYPRSRGEHAPDDMA